MCSLFHVLLFLRVFVRCIVISVSLCDILSIKLGAELLTDCSESKYILCMYAFIHLFALALREESSQIIPNLMQFCSDAFRTFFCMSTMSKTKRNHVLVIIIRAAK